MGHDIYGFKNKKYDTEIAYLCRSAFSNQAHSIYKALNATEYDIGCCGSRDTVFFNRQQLKNALNKLPQGKEHEPERQFIQDLLDKGDETGAWIGFY